MDNSFGSILKITLFGESHGELIGVIVDGVPAGFVFDTEIIQKELNTRRPGQSRLVSSRNEEDKLEVLSGIFNERATGAPICLIIKNKDQNSSEYEKFKKYLRPSHIDYSALKRFGGYSDYRGSGRFSGRMTAALVMAGAIAKQILRKYEITIFAFSKSIGNIIDENEYHLLDYKNLYSLREKSLLRCLDSGKSKLMENLVENVKKLKDSIGGTIKCTINNFPAGKGGPIFNSLESKISEGIFSIPSIKGIEFGAGFNATRMRGSVHNDPWIVKNGKVQTTKNDSGGIIGGISTGMPIEFTVAVKPTASIGVSQKTVNIETLENVEIEFTGRHDPCIVPRVIPVVESITALVLLDCLMIDGFIPRIFKS